jgi:UDP-N-acetylmuramoyl-L-alanyl-D-glutamate--2,6-diaminopimelate ligase
MINLKDIAKIVGVDAPSIKLEYLSANTKDIKPNTLFLAYKGLNFDARESIEEVISKGAKAVFYDDSDNFVPNSQLSNQIFICGISNLEKFESSIASAFYNTPSQDIDLIGLTGTNGKSSVTYLISVLLNELGVKSALMGTLGNGIYPNLKPTSNTTLRPLLLEQTISSLKNDNVKAIAMEVSSHGLALGRVEKLNFSYAAYTNLSRDHLDFHKNMENYAKEKFKLFTMLNSPKNAVINIEDDNGFEFAMKLPGCVVYSKTIERYEQFKQELKDKNTHYPFICPTNIKFLNDGIELELNSSWGNAKTKIHLIGSFNIENVLCAFGVLLCMGYSLSSICEKAKKLKPLIGRMEQFLSNNGKATLIVDYAHTPDGLEKALKALKEHDFGEITVICGCGGDRDTGKRPEMAKIAVTNAHKTIFTNDNPRTEEPEDIITMMLKGVTEFDNYNVIYDRKAAIETAYKTSKSSDVILIAGKGHEDYQIIGTIKHHYSDREVATELTGDNHD